MSTDTGRWSVVTVTDAPRRRRSAEETRQLLLEAGTQLVLQSLEADDVGASGPLAHIRVQDVVRAASEQHGTPVTTGALYNLWSTQTAYQVDLMFFILREGAYPAADQMAKLATQLLAQRVPFEELGARLTDESFRLELGSPLGRAAGAFTALAGVPAIREALRAGHAELLSSARELYSQLLTYGGLQLREPYELDQLITVIGALNDGLLQRHAVVPELFDVPAGSRSLVATSVQAVFAAFCEPAGPGQ
jgi:AcrR family transcriptional regulator